MANTWGILLVLFVLAHAFVTVAIFVMPAPPGAPFQAKRSWLLTSLNVSEDVQSILCAVLAVIAALALIAGALGVFGVPGLASVWPWLIVGGAAVSLPLMAIYFNAWLGAGAAINIGLLVAILVFQWPTNAALGI